MTATVERPPKYNRFDPEQNYYRYAHKMAAWVAAKINECARDELVTVSGRRLTVVGDNAPHLELRSPRNSRRKNWSVTVTKMTLQGGVRVYIIDSGRDFNAAGVVKAIEQERRNGTRALKATEAAQQHTAKAHVAATHFASDVLLPKLDGTDLVLRPSYSIEGSCINLVAIGDRARRGPLRDIRLHYGYGENQRTRLQVTVDASFDDPNDAVALLAGLAQTSQLRQGFGGSVRRWIFTDAQDREILVDLDAPSGRDVLAALINRGYKAVRIAGDDEVAASGDGTAS